jgi:hypothetical protein
MIPGLPVSSVW